MNFTAKELKILEGMVKTYLEMAEDVREFAEEANDMREAFKAYRDSLVLKGLLNKIQDEVKEPDKTFEEDLNEFKMNYQLMSEEEINSKVVYLGRKYGLEYTARRLKEEGFFLGWYEVDY